MRTAHAIYAVSMFEYIREKEEEYMWAYYNVSGSIGFEEACSRVASAEPEEALSTSHLCVCAGFLRERRIKLIFFSWVSWDCCAGFY